MFTVYISCNSSNQILGYNNLQVFTAQTVGGLLELDRAESRQTPNMVKRYRKGIRKSIVAVFLPCLIAFGDSIPIAIIFCDLLQWVVFFRGGGGGRGSMVALLQLVYPAATF